ncbi:MAG: hypothetical protein ACRELD_11080 [Longimicrobiales bacterium]
MDCRGLAAVGLALSLLSAAGLRAQERVAIEDTDEAYLSLRYADLVNTVVTARFHQDSIYLPVGALFGALGINYDLDPRVQRITGEWGREPRLAYRIDAVAGRATVGERVVRFDTDAIITGDLDIFVLPSLLASSFGLRFVVDLRNLIVRVESTEPLPIAEAAELERRRTSARPEPLIQPHAPLRYDRQRHAFYPGVVEYGVSAAAQESATAWTLELGGGAEVLGGDAHGRLLGTRDALGTQLVDADLRWRYVFTERDRLLNQLSIGRMVSSGLRPLEYYGVDVSNEPLRLRAMLGSHTLFGTAEPGWEVELYIGEQLLGFTRVDADGSFRFSLPLTYGTSLITLRYYGPGGERRSEQRRLQVPFFFVPPAQLDYRLSAGRTALAGRSLVQAHLAYGLRERLTLRGGVDYTDSIGAGHRALFVGAATRWRNLVAATELAPGNFWRADAELSGLQSSYGVSYAFYPTRSVYQPTALRHHAALRLFAPTQLGTRSFTFRVTADGQRYGNELTAYSGSADAILNLPLLKPSVGYLHAGLIDGGQTYTLSEELTGGVLYHVLNPPVWLEGLRGGLLQARLSYDLRQGGLSRTRVDLARNLTTSGRLSLAVERDGLADAWRFEVRYFYDGPGVRSSVGAQRHGAQTLMTSSVRGAIGYDPRTRTIVPSGREWLGSGGAAIRLFLDRDGNGRWDADEPLITGDAVRFRQALAARLADDGTLRTSDLMAYNQYSAEIDEGVIPNPLWVPRFDSFSFIVDPNGFKQIDVPFYVGGVVEGRVTRQDGPTARPVGGLRIRIRNLSGGSDETASTFSDGSYYYMGLPPGDYEAVIDSGQLALLELAATPRAQRFSVSVTEYGDFVEGLDFVLR